MQKAWQANQNLVAATTQERKVVAQEHRTSLSRMQAFKDSLIKEKEELQQRLRLAQAAMGRMTCNDEVKGKRT